MNWRFIKNVNYMVLAQGGNYLLPLLLIPYLVRTLSLPGFGDFSLAQSVFNVSLIIVQFGFNIFTTKLIAETHREKNELAKFVSNTLYVQVSFATILVLMFLATYLICPENQVVFLLFLYSFGLLGQSLFPVWYFHGKEKFREYALLTFMLRLLIFLLIVTFVKDESMIWLVPISYSFGYIVFGLVGLSSLFRERIIQMPDVATMRYLVKKSRDVFFSSLVSSVIVNMPILFMGMNASKAEVGGFSAIYRILVAIKGFFNSAFMVLLPHLAASKKRIYRKEIAVKVFFFTFLPTILLLTLENELLYLLYGDKVAEIMRQIYATLMVSIVPAVLATLYIYVFASLKEMYVQRRNVFLVILGLNLLLYYPVTLHSGGIGASYLILLSDFVLLLLSLRMFRRVGV